MQHKEEILAKKAKLAELRRQREAREQRQKEQGRRESTLGSEESSELRESTPKRHTDRKDLDEFIEKLVGDRPASRGPGTPSPGPRRPRPLSTLSGVQVGAESYEQSSSTASSAVQTSSIATQTDLGEQVGTTTSQAPPQAEQPSKKETYHKFTQTAEEWLPPRRRGSRGNVSDVDSDGSPTELRTPRSSKRLSRRQRVREQELRENLRREIEDELKAARDLTVNGTLTSDAPKFPARGLTNEELDAVTSSEDFLDFIDRSSKVIEKALEQDFDVLADYALDGVEADEDEDEGYVSGRGKKGRRVRQVTQFYDEKWCGKRMICDMCFSPKFPELLLASYTKNAASPQDPTSVLHVWNMHLQSRPEHTFHATSDVLSAIFSPFHPSIIIGGTYTGQVMLWDLRARSPLPVAKTPLTGASSGGHTHPIYSISLVGTQNANNIISCSTDGVVCGWTTDMLTVPQEYLELTSPPPAKTEDLAPICMSFPESDPTSFLVGTEEGTIFPCHRYDRAGAKAGVDTKLRYRGHTAPIMSLDFHPARGPVDLGDLVLSTSLDWSIKLWKTRPASSTAVQGSGATTTSITSSTATTTTPTTTSIPTPTPGTTSSTTAPTSSSTSSEHIIPPLLDLTREDVVYSARWSPHRPGVFASVDGAGNLDIWDLATDTEVPVARTRPHLDRTSPSHNPTSTTSPTPNFPSTNSTSLPSTSLAGLDTIFGPDIPKSLGKVVWEPKEGRRLAVGGAAGVVTVFDVGSDLGGDGGRTEDWARMKRVGEERRAGLY